MSKGSKRRPMQVSRQEFETNWAAAFGNGDAAEGTNDHHGDTESTEERKRAEARVCLPPSALRPPPLD